MSSSGEFNIDRSDKFAALAQYGRDVQQRNNDNSTNVETSPAVEEPIYNSDYPVCASCDKPMFHDWDDHKYR
jgi:hypothetical protein